jgi:hypothetical protein
VKRDCFLTDLALLVYGALKYVFEHGKFAVTVGTSSIVLDLDWDEFEYDYDEHGMQQ